MPNKSGPNLSNDQRHCIVCNLFEHSKDGKAKHGNIGELASKYNVSRRTITLIWNKGKHQRSQGLEVDVRGKIKGKKGKAKIIPPLQLVKSLPIGKRRTIRRLAISINIKKTTVWNWIKAGILESHTSAIKPDLTQDNKYLRLHFCLSKLYFNNLLKCIMFKEMNTDVHIDEKLFFLTKASRRVILVPGEGKPYRSCKSKRFIMKVMFMAVTARPIYNIDLSLLWDGKLGIFPLTYKVPAINNSKNRARGTLVTKSYEHLNREVMKGIMLNKVIPCIKQQWPIHGSKDINIQQDNAPPHIKGNDPDFVRAATSDGFNMRLTQQPPNSPETNVWDLGLFAAVQAIQEECPSKNIDQLIQVVEQAWAEIPPLKVNNVWLSLHVCMVEIMKAKGHNNYQLPHLKKAAQIRAGTLPRNLVVSEELVYECLSFLSTVAQTLDLTQIMHQVGVTLPPTLELTFP